MKGKDKIFILRFGFCNKSYNFVDKSMKTRCLLGCLLLVSNLFSQSCVDTSVQSCLGPNLVVNGGFESGNAGFQSDYNYGLPGNGAYLIMSADASTINVGWQCTGNPGKYLLGDGYIGSNNSKAVWRQTISNTKIDSLYVFMIDINNPIMPSWNGYYSPNITMTINGIKVITTVIGQSPDKWITMCCKWKCDNNSTVIEIMETYGNATGCDFTLDNVYFGRYNSKQETEYKFICGDSIILDAGEASISGYLWSNNATGRKIKVLKAGTYTVEYSNGCPAEKIFIVTNDNPGMDLGPKDTIVCGDISLTAKTTTSKVYWNTLDTGKTIKATQSGIYVAWVKDGCGDTIADTINVIKKKPKKPLFPRDTIFCETEKGVWVTLENYGFKYEVEGVSLDSFLADRSGKYFITAYDSCNDEYKDTFTIELLKPATFDLPGELKICAGQEAILEIPTNLMNIKWGNGQTNHKLAIKDMGRIWVEATDSCGNIRKDTVNVILDSCLDCKVYIPNAFTPNNDDVNEKFSPVFSCPVVAMEFKVFNRWGELLYLSEDLNAAWNGFYKGSICQQEVYMFIINAKTSNGSIYRYFYKSGTFHLLL